MGGIRKRLKSLDVIHYIFVFSTMVLLIIFTMGALLYYSFYQNVYSAFFISNEEHLSAIVNRHEDDIRMLKNIEMQMAISGNVTKFILENQPYKSVQLKNQLYQYTIVSQFFSMVMYIYHEDSYLYTHTTSIDMNYFLNTAFRLEYTSEEELRSLLYAEDGHMAILKEQEVNGFWIQNYIGNSRVVLYIVPIASKYTDSLMFVVKDTYYDVLLENDSENKREDFIFYNEEAVVTRGSLAVDQKKLLNYIDGSDGQKQIELDGEKYLLSVRHGDSGLVYCSLQSADIFHEKLMTSQWGVFSLLLICTIPTALWIVMLTQNIGNKLQKMNRLLNVEQEQNYNLNSIENGIRLLVISNEEKEKENRQLKKTRFISSFVRSDFSDEKQIWQAAEKLDMKVNYTFFLVILMGERGDTNEKKAHRNMLEVIARTEHLDGYGIHLVSNNQSVFVIFGDEKAKMEEVIDRLFAIGKEYYEDFVMAVSAYHENLTEGAKSYLEAATAYDNRFLQDNNKIIRFTEVIQMKYIDVLPENYLQNFRHTIKRRDKEGVKQAVESICTRMTRESPSLLTFRLLYNDILHLVISEWKGNIGETESIYNVFALSQCLTVQDLNALLCEACSAIIDNQPLTEADGSELVNSAIAYMQEHFSEPELNMSTLSDYLQISSVTLSVEFKNHTGLRPSDYLANLRMEQAKELLLSGNMLIREVSLAVGYEDDHVFTRRFKKYTGKTPGQYREERQ